MQVNIWDSARAANNRVAKRRGEAIELSACGGRRTQRSTRPLSSNPRGKGQQCVGMSIQGRRDCVVGALVQMPHSP